MSATRTIYPDFRLAASGVMIVDVLMVYQKARHRDMSNQPVTDS